jgi:hypothetical protein
MGCGKQRVVNGVIAGVKPSIPKQTRDRIRAALHRLQVRDIRSEDEESYIATQKGRIVYFKSVNPQQITSLEVELSRLLEQESKH